MVTVVTHFFRQTTLSEMIVVCRTDMSVKAVNCQLTLAHTMTMERVIFPEYQENKKKSNTMVLVLVLAPHVGTIAPADPPQGMSRLLSCTLCSTSYTREDLLKGRGIEVAAFCAN